MYMMMRYTMNFPNMTRINPKCQHIKLIHPIIKTNKWINTFKKSSAPWSFHQINREKISGKHHVQQLKDNRRDDFASKLHKQMLKRCSKCVIISLMIDIRIKVYRKKYQQLSNQKRFANKSDRNVPMSKSVPRLPFSIFRARILKSVKTNN